MYQIIRQKRKTLSIHIDDKLNIVIKVPHYLKTSEMNKFIKKHEKEIEKMLRDKASLQESNDWRLTQRILYLGEYKTIHYVENSLKEEAVLSGDRLMIQMKACYEEAVAKKIVGEFFKGQAYILLKSLTDYYADLLEVSYNKISIRHQKTRWGSCSAKGNISYNMKLLCAPEEVIRYVVLHEVMHLKHFNHGKLF